MKYLLVTGGVISGLGKGITASSLGVLLQAHGCSVTAMKIDPYLNQDSGTISPFEHGECFVLSDGGEADLDMGSYERFLGINLGRDNNITTGKVFRQVFERERKGDYLGATVQIVPHITDEITTWISRVGNTGGFDVCILELGGTVGDIESLPFLEALRQMTNGDDTFCHVHVSYLPVLKTTDEIKTKPTQESVKNVCRYGIPPDFLCLRCEEPISDTIVAKVSKFCGIRQERILKNVDVSNIYQVPISFAHVLPELWSSLELPGVPSPTEKWSRWKTIAGEFDIFSTGNRTGLKKITIGIVGKYSGLCDSYLSLTHAIKHAAVSLQCCAKIRFYESSELNVNDLSQCHAVIIPGGFGQRGIEGMITAARYTRDKCIPTLGICLGMQVMVIEGLRSDAGWPDANSVEFDPDTSHPVLIIMDSEEEKLGGTMRLGASTVKITDHTSQSMAAYSTEEIVERHRHRYEVNPIYRPFLTRTPAGERSLNITAFDPTGTRVEMVEDPEHPFYVGCQFHPEYQTYPDKPHPLFTALIKATPVVKPADLLGPDEIENV